MVGRMGVCAVGGRCPWPWVMISLPVVELKLHGVKASLLCLIYNYAYTLPAMGAYEGGAHVPLLPRMPYWGGLPVCPCAFMLLYSS
jgi:hypothetical protein